MCTDMSGDRRRGGEREIETKPFCDAFSFLGDICICLSKNVLKKKMIPPLFICLLKFIGTTLGNNII